VIPSRKRHCIASLRA